MQGILETPIRSLGQEDPLKKEVANPLQYSHLENPMDRGAWRITVHMLGEVHWLKPPRPGTWPGTIETICMSCFMTGDSGKEHRTNKPPPTTRVQERSKGDTTHTTTSQKPSHWHLSWLSNVCTTMKDSAQNGWPKTTRKLIPSPSNPRLRARAGRAVLLGSLTLLLSSWQPLPDKISCIVCTCVTSDSFPSVRQEWLLALEGVPLSATHGVAKIQIRVSTHTCPCLN